MKVRSKESKNSKDSKDDQKFRRYFKLFTIGLLLVVLIIMLYKDRKLYTLSEALVNQQHVLAGVIASGMLISTILFYYGFCVVTKNKYKYRLCQSLVPIVLLLVFIFDLENYSFFHHMLLVLYGVITLLYIFSHTPWAILFPIFIFPTLYFLSIKDISVYEFLYILFAVLAF